MRIVLALVDDKERRITNEVDWWEVPVSSLMQVVPPDAGISPWVRYHAALRFLRERDVRKLTELPHTELRCPLCQVGQFAFYSPPADKGYTYALCVFCGRLYRIDGDLFPTNDEQDEDDVLEGAKQKAEVNFILQKMSQHTCDQYGVDADTLRNAVRSWVREWVNLDVLSSSVLQLSPSQIFHWVMQLLDAMVMAFVAKGILPFVSDGLLHQQLGEPKSMLAFLAGEGAAPAGMKLATFCRVRNKILQELLYAILVMEKNIGSHILTLVPQLSVMLFYPTLELFPYLHSEAVRVLRNRVLPQVSEKLLNENYPPLWGVLLKTRKIAFINAVDPSGSTTKVVGELIKPCIVKLAQSEVYYILRVWSKENDDFDEMEKAELLYPSFVVVDADGLVELIEKQVIDLLHSEQPSENNEGDNKSEV